MSWGKDCYWPTSDVGPNRRCWLCDYLLEPLLQHVQHVTKLPRIAKVFFLGIKIYLVLRFNLGADEAMATLRPH